MTDEEIRRGVHRAAAGLKAAIQAYLDRAEAEPKPSAWTGTARDILNSVRQFRQRTSNSDH